jgi:16S rRNA (adenine1518-N6/adenine1519-N6)-dimethyltransferase
MKKNFFPLKRLGQVFLVKKEVVKKIIEAADLKKEETVLEIGPGKGVLTFELAKRVKRVMAVEKDKRLVEFLKKKKIKNVEVLEGDILKILKNLPPFEKVVANIPYYLTSRLIRELLETKRRPKTIVLMVQKEVAQRVCAKPPKTNLLALTVQFWAKPKIVAFVSKDCFWPKPKVDSAILKIVPSPPLLPPRSRKKFFQIVKAGFSQPRKQLANNLSKFFSIKKEEIQKWLLEIGVDPKVRAENLSFKNWLDLLNFIK